ncbi:DUF6734 family protein [Pedobacter nototheniae]|uniref:DUF6734 family protein n=1 Tax=Pedobacter nototheniae TaxID=2488994 RepID=UPI00292D054A|nr:DUF6734 family protein [Pedobacter nototheniae]
MQIIQSYWACNKKDILTNQPGWVSPEYNLMSWALSCMQLNKYYQNVTLYCDKETKKILIDELKLPYANVCCELDSLNTYQPDLWALPKIYVYEKQTSPFLHVDGDVFIWEKFEEKLMRGNLIAQNLESATSYYEKIMQDLENHLSFFPKEILDERKKGNQILAYNAGIFGGNDYKFFNFYAKKAFDFVNKNILNLNEGLGGNFNIFFEQYLFYCLVKKQKKSVGVLLNQVIGDNEYKGFGDFINVPYDKKYLHILGSYKKNEVVCLQLANRLRLDYPKYYYAIIDLYKCRNIPLYHDYYKSFDGNKSERLNWSKDLKHNYKVGVNYAKSSIFLKKDALIPEPVGPLVESELLDFDIFSTTIKKIVYNKFSKISELFLYGRDLNCTEYFEYLFADVSNIYKKKIVAMEYTEIIKSQNDWSQINNRAFTMRKGKKPFDNFFTAIVPECNQFGYSLSNLDLLDIEILKEIKSIKTIGRLLNDCKKMFDKNEVETSKVEFEKLVFGRIKKGINNKTIGVLY